MTTAATAAPRYIEPYRVQAAGAEIAYRRSGSGEPVLFFHGHWLTRCWSPFHARLADHADVIAPEAPGFGDSPCPPWVTGRDDVTLIFRGLLDALDVPRAHLVGHGLGAWLAADFAIWNPERAASLSVLAPYGIRVPGEPLADIFLMSPASYDDMYFNGEPVPGIVPGPGTPADGGPEGFAQRYGDMGAAARLIWDFRYDLKLEQRLPRLGIPARVIAGTADRIVPAAHSARWAELLGTRPKTVHGGHAFHVQRPAEAADLVTSFISEARGA